eukprot:403332044
MIRAVRQSNDTVTQQEQQLDQSIINDKALSSNPVKQNCLDSFSQIFNVDTLSTDPSQSFNSYLNDFCLAQPLEVPNAVKASTCFYSGYFLARYMTPERDNKERLENLKQDFCDKYLDILPKRTAFVQQLKNKIQESGQGEFDSQCENLLKTTQGLNLWFDPIDPMVSISQTEICDIHKKLFNSLNAKGIQSLAEFVSFSYLITMDLYLNANQQQDYESCIQTQILTSPKQTCLDLLHSNPVFLIWPETSKADLCIEAAQKVTVGCNGVQSCDACAIQLATMYKGYEQYINGQYSTVFQTYEKQIFQSLDTENKKTKYSQNVQQQLMQTNRRSRA